MKPHTYLSVSIDDQKLSLIIDGVCVREFVVSTALKGMGTAIGSFRTPTGNFRICQKIGAGEPIGRIFRAREPKGLWDPSQATDDDMILTRILRLDGLDDSNANTLERCIYIHGTNREDLLGVPSSHGCIRMRNDQIVELFEQLEVGDVVQIQPATKPFVDLFVGCGGVAARPMMTKECDRRLDSCDSASADELLGDDNRIL